METQAFQDIMQDTSMYDAHSTASSEAGSPFPATGVMSVNSENEMPSIEAAHSTTSSYEDDGKLRTILLGNLYLYSPMYVRRIASNMLLFIYVNRFSRGLLKKTEKAAKKVLCPTSTTKTRGQFT